MKIIVTQHHIDQGFRGSAFRCPIAWAVQDATKKDTVVVGVETFSVRKDSWETTFSTYDQYRIPKKIQGYIKAFDAGETVQPITFTARKMK